MFDVSLPSEGFSSVEGCTGGRMAAVMVPFTGPQGPIREVKMGPKCPKAKSEGPLGKEG